MLNNLRITEVVKNLIIINVLFYLGSHVILGDYGGGIIEDLDRGFLALHPTPAHFQPYQVITHMFMHGDFMHILFNMWALFMFGPPLEALWGGKRFLIFYLICGFGAMGLHLGVIYVGWIPPHAMLGASGAIMGVLMAFGLSFPNQKIMLLIPPIPLKAMHFVLLLIAADLFFGISRTSNGIANFAHLGGALTGFLLVMYWRKFGSRL